MAMSNIRKLIRNKRKMEEVGHSSPESMAKEIKSLRKGSPDYYDIRRELSLLSGVPMMAIVTMEHIEVIDKKIKELEQLRAENAKLNSIISKGDGVSS